VAGRELLDENGGKFTWGGWIRPVSTHHEGALDFTERRLAGPAEPTTLDLIQVPLSLPENNPLQPENWFLQVGQPWTKESMLQPDALLSLVEEPHDLWLQPHQKADRATPAFLQQLAHLQSLYLIRPESFEFELRSTTWDGVPKKRARALFTYKTRHYDLSLTDPKIGQKYFPDFRRTPEGYIKPHDSAKLLLCISLTPPFNDGLHYKVVATVLELPA